MSSTNIDYLLQNYRVEDVLGIQKRLKSDVEKKQNDLKHLIGERYHELLETTNSIDEMNASVHELIHSLKCLEKTLDAHSGKQKDDPGQSTLTVESQRTTQTNLISFLLDLPLKIYDDLIDGQIVMATYKYFYGLHLYEQVVGGGEKSSLVYRLIQFKGIRCNITENCWKYLSKSVKQNEILPEAMADHIACLLVLRQDLNVSKFLLEYFRKQSESLVEFAKRESELSTTITSILNTFINNIELVEIYQANDSINGAESLLVQRFSNIINQNYSRSLDLQGNESGFKIGSIFSVSALVIDSEAYQMVSNEHLSEWIESMKVHLDTVLQAKVTGLSSLNQVFLQINQTEQRIQKTQSNRLRQCKFNFKIDLYDRVWKQFILSSVFEARVYDIIDIQLGTIVDELAQIVSLVAQCRNLEVLDSVWRSPKPVNTSLVNLVHQACQVVNNQLELIAQDLLSIQYHKTLFVKNICSKLVNFFHDLKNVHFAGKLGDEGMEQINLFAAMFFSKISTKSPSVEGIFVQQQNEVVTKTETDVSWKSVQSQLTSYSDSCYSDWFQHCIVSSFGKTDSCLFTSIDSFLANLTVWDSHPVESEVNNESSDAQQATFIQVPNQICLTTNELFYSVCNDINRFGAYSLSSSVLRQVASMFECRLIRLYEQCIERYFQNESSQSLPKSALQIMAIQLYFDLVFVSKFFTKSSPDCSKRTEEAISKLEAVIDPFDLHLLHPHMHSNVEKLLKSCNILFGFLVSANRSAISKKVPETTTSATSSKHNIMLVHSCPTDFSET